MAITSTKKLEVTVKLNNSSAFEKIKEQQERIRRLVEPQALRILKEFHQQRNLILANLPDKYTVNRIQEQVNHFHNFVNSPAFQTLKNFQKQRQHSLNFRNVVNVDIARDIQDKIYNLYDIANTGGSIFKHAKDIQEQHRQLLLNSAQLPAIRAIAEEATRAFNQSFANADFFNSFSWGLINSLNCVHGNFEEEAIEEDADIIEEYFNEQCQELSPNIISYEGLLQILIAIIFYVHTLYMNTQTKQRLDYMETHNEKRFETLLKSQDRIVEQLKKIKPEEVEETFYLVVRNVHVRTKPTTKSLKIGVLYPNQKVTLIKPKEKWIYVEYFDYIESIPKTGWVYKKNLKLIR